MRVRGKGLALLIGSCAFVLLATVSIAYREDIATAYHVQRLRWDPALLFEYLDRYEKPAIARAVVQFSRTDEGKRTLIDTLSSDREMRQSFLSGKHQVLLKDLNASDPLWAYDVLNGRAVAHDDSDGALYVFEATGVSTNKIGKPPMVFDRVYLSSSSRGRSIFTFESAAEEVVLDIRREPNGVPVHTLR